MRRPALLLPALLATAGCAHDMAGYPSLAPRAVEKQSFDEPARPSAAVAPDAALDAAVAARGADLDVLVAGFDRAAASTGKAVEHSIGASVGSEAWLDAQADLAALDDWRARTSALAVGLDDLAAARAARLDPAYPTLDALIARAGAETARQTQAVQDLQRRVPGA